MEISSLPIKVIVSIVSFPRLIYTPSATVCSREKKKKKKTAKNSLFFSVRWKTNLFLERKKIKEKWSDFEFFGHTTEADKSRIVIVAIFFFLINFFILFLRPALDRPEIVFQGERKKFGDSNHLATLDTDSEQLFQPNETQKNPSKLSRNPVKPCVTYCITYSHTEKSFKTL